MGSGAESGSPGTPARVLDRLGIGRLRHLYFGWYLVLAGTLCNFILVGATTYGFGVFIDPIKSEMGWTVAAISAAYSLRTFEQGLMGPVAGFTIDRFGPRKVALLGTVAMIVGLVVYSQVHSLWMFYVSAIIIALGQSFGPAPAFMVIIMKWFVALRGRASGIMQAGIGLGPFGVPILGFLVAAFGWRETLLIVAAFVLVTALPLALLIRPSPEPYGLLPDGDKATGTRAEAEAAKNKLATSTWGLTVGEALRTRSFYFLGVAWALMVGTQNAWIVHEVPLFKQAGFSMAAIGLFGGVIAVVAMIARIACGWLGDYVGHRTIFTVAFAFQAAGLLILANIGPGRHWLWPFVAVILPLGGSGVTVADNTVTAEYFGTKRYASIRGLKAALSLPLGVGMPIIAGRMFDSTGSYHLIFTIFAAMVATGVVWALLAGRPKPANVPAHQASPA